MVTDADEVVELVGQHRRTRPPATRADPHPRPPGPVAARVLEALPAGAARIGPTGAGIGHHRDVAQSKLMELRRWDSFNGAVAAGSWCDTPGRPSVPGEAVLDLGRTGERVRGMTAESRFALLRRGAGARGDGDVAQRMHSVPPAASPRPARPFGRIRPVLVSPRFGGVTRGAGSGTYLRTPEPGLLAQRDPRSRYAHKHLHPGIRIHPSDLCRTAQGDECPSTSPGLTARR